MSIDNLVESFKEMSIFCGNDEYIELVRNNNILTEILQTNILNPDFLDYICFKFNYYKEKINFDYSKYIYTEYCDEIEEIKNVLESFLETKDTRNKLLFAKEFHNRVIQTINDINAN